MRVLIDLNVIVDALTTREPFCDDARKILQLANNDEIVGFISAHEMSTLYYLLRRNGFDDINTRGKIEEILTFIIVLDTTRYDCHWALKSPIKDYEDAVLLETAAREKIDVIVTRNKKDFMGVKNKVKIMTPKELATQLKY